LDDNKKKDRYSSHSMTGGCCGMTGTIWSLDSVSNLDVSLSSATWNDKCDETFKQMIYTEILEHAFGIAKLGVKITGCDSISKYCQWDSLAGVRARQICPVTCGCHDPRISVAIGGSNNGCSPSCAQTKGYTSVQRTRPCEDAGEDHEYWKGWKQSVDDLALSYPPSWRAPYNKIAKLVNENHCDITAVKDPVSDWRSMCTRSYFYYIKPLVHACPVACGCNVTLHEHCPLSCRT